MDTTIAAPARFVVVDGNAYWIQQGPEVAQPGGGRAIRWVPLAVLMQAPATPAGFAWAAVTPAAAFDDDQADAIIAALTETYAGLKATQEVA